ncbi:rhomboid family intramembrane serine protease [Corynebacterium breve]|uniref:Rhomboid family intramembrane serine protease n=1 Tax=Corynebacterium breve TaxID=3049799 RepID=A0ABY8VE72_9CORY|nr:rhomboid family intramembrane serine protease [Corynebacterium breve]WIM67251.1 rhomboid family intramembrane serine protease [Corynebacterium breve]
MTYLPPSYNNPNMPQGPREPQGPTPGVPSRSPVPNTGYPAQHAKSYGAKTGLLYAAGYVVVIWTVHLVNLIFYNGRLIGYGIHPLDPSGLLHIFTSPLLHGSFEHLISNTVPGAIFCFIIGFSGHRVFWEVTMIAMIVGGVGVWLFGGVGTNHIGASGLVYGWLAYLLIRGIFNRSGRQILLGLGLGFIYSGFVWGVLPGTPGVSWQAHLFGALGGFGAGVFITSDDPPALRARRDAKKLQR